MNSIKKILPEKITSLHYLLGFIMASVLILSLSLASNSCLIHKWCGQDMDQYKDYSDSLLTGHGYAAHKVINMYYLDPHKNNLYIPEILRLPAYPLVLTGARLLLNSPFVVLILNYLSYIGILIYTYLLSKYFFSFVGRIIVFLLVAFNALILYHGTQIGNADIFVCLAIVGSAYHIFSLYEKKSYLTHTFLATLWSVLAIFSRQNSVLFIVPLLFLTLIFSEKKFFKKNMRHILGIFIGICFFLLLWVGRNYIQTQRFVFSALSGSQLFTEHIYFTPIQTKETRQLIKWFTVDDGPQKYITAKQKKENTYLQAYISMDGYLSQIAYRYIFTHPIESLKHYFFAFISFYTGATFSWETRKIEIILMTVNQILSWVYTFVLLVFPLLFIKRKGRRFLSYGTFWIASMLFITISAFYHGIVIGSRGVLAILPIIIIITIVFIGELILRMFHNPLILEQTFDTAKSVKKVRRKKKTR